MKQTMRKWTEIGRKGMALLLALVMVLGVCMPVYATGDATEPTEPTTPETTLATEPETVETTAPAEPSAQAETAEPTVESSEPAVEPTVEESSEPETTVGDDAPGVPETTEPETTEPASNETTAPASSETTEPETAVPETTVGDDALGVPDTTVPEQVETDDQPVMAPAPEKSAYEVAMEKLAAKAEEAKSLEKSEEALDEYYERLRTLYSYIFDLYDADEPAITGEEMDAATEIYASVLSYLKDTYGYENGEIAVMAGTKTYSADYIDTVTVAESGIDFNLYNYSKYINKVSSSDSAAFRSYAQYLPFRYTYDDEYREGGKKVVKVNGTQYYKSDDLLGLEPTDLKEVDQLSYNHMRYTRNLIDGYPQLSAYSGVGNTHKADGMNGIDGTVVDVGYLWGKGSDHAVTKYEDIVNTPLTYDASTGYYTYNSAKNAIDLVGKRVYMRNYVERGWSSANFGVANNNPIGDFFPFNSLVDFATSGSKDVTTHYFTKNNEDDTALPEGVTEKDAFYYKDGVIVAGDYQYTKEQHLNGVVDYWMGASMHATFYMPKDARVNGNPMRYDFSGDDDVMVYIDNVMVMDLGGAHSKASGNIDFETGLVEMYLDAHGDQKHKEIAKTVAANGYKVKYTEAGSKDLVEYSKDNGITWTVLKYYTKTIYECYEEAYKEQGLSDVEISKKLADVFEPVLNADGTQKTVSDVLGKAHKQYRFKEYTQHTFDWFYMERHEGQSNFYTKFNLPTLPANTLTVAKDVKNAPADDSFRFQVILKNNEQKALEEVYYSINGVKQANPMKLNDGVGTFSLKDDEYYTFDLATNYTYEVRELDANSGGYKTTVSGDEDGRISDGVPSYVAYTNTYEAGSIVTDKKVSEVINDEIGDYLLTLEAYTQGTSVIEVEQAPSDIVIVVDQSGTMYEPLNTEPAYTYTLNNGQLVTPEGKPIDQDKAAALREYYVAWYTDGVTDDHYYFFVTYEEGQWYAYYLSRGYTDNVVGDSWRANIQTDIVFDKTNRYPLAYQLNNVLTHDPNAEYTTCDGVTIKGQKDETKLNPVNLTLTGVYQTRYGAAYDQIYKFIDDTSKSSVEHNIALVGFSGPVKRWREQDNLGSGIFDGGNLTHYTDLTDAYDYAGALKSAKTEKDTLMASLNAIDTSYAHTAQAVGLVMANKILEATKDNGREKLVVMLTDGLATVQKNYGSINNSAAWARGEAVKEAKITKQTYGADIFVVGTLSESEANGDDVVFLDYVSSNYPEADAELVTANNTRYPVYSNVEKAADTKYYQNATNLTALEDIFAEISNSSIVSKVELDADTILRDTISQYFDLPEGIKKEDIKVYVAPYEGNGAFGNRDEATEAPADVKFTPVINIDGKVVQVSGFDYSKHFIYEATDTEHARGYKLIVEIPIVIDETNTGGNKQPTNIDENSGIYDDGNRVEEFDQPHVDTPVDVTVKKKVTGNMGDWSKEFTFTATVTEYTKVDDKYYDNELDSQVGNSNYLEAKDRVQEVTYEGDTAIKLKNGESELLDNLYYGSTVTITEAPENYTLEQLVAFVDADGDGEYDDDEERIATEEIHDDDQKLIGVELTATKDMVILFTNDYEVTIETGIALDSLPYILIIAIVAVGGAVLFLRKRKVED